MPTHDETPVLDLTRTKVPDIVREAERRRLLRELGLSFSAALSLEDCQDRMAARDRAGRLTAEQAIADGLPPGEPSPRILAAGAVRTVGDPPLARRAGDTLELVLLFAPRTKKNSKAHLAQQSLGYRRFRNAVRSHLRSLAGDLALPLPEQRYNIEALFFTDNDAADTVGLMQGLADALQDAGVLPNDRLLWTWDGTDQWLDKTNPRVELRIMPRPSAAARSLGLFHRWRAAG